MCFFSYGNRSPLKKKILRFINIVSFKTIYQELIQEKLYYLIVPFFFSKALRTRDGASCLLDPRFLRRKNPWPWKMSFRIIDNGSP